MKSKKHQVNKRKFLEWMLEDKEDVENVWDEILDTLEKSDEFMNFLKDITGFIPNRVLTNPTNNEDFEVRPENCIIL